MTATRNCFNFFMQKNKSRNARLVAMDEGIVETVSVNVSLVTMDGIVRKVSNHHKFLPLNFAMQASH